MNENDKRALDVWLSDLRNPVFTSMDATEDSTAWVDVAVADLAKRSPARADVTEQVKYLRQRSPSGVISVLRDKWRA